MIKHLTIYLASSKCFVNSICTLEMESGQGRGPMEQELREMMEKIYKNENALHRIHSFVRIFIQRYM